MSRRAISLHRWALRLRKIDALRILAGPRQQTSGKIRSQPTVGPVENAMVFQDSGLFPWMSIEANVALRLDTRGVPRVEAGRAWRRR